ncbi:Root phototropism protein 2 [Linum grandiflorum]
MLVAKSNYIRKVIIDSEEADLTRIDLSDIPGGPEIFEKAAKFCYGVNFEITVHNVAALRCAAEYLQMTDAYCDGNLAGRTDDFLSQVALSSLSGAVVVLKSCEDLLPLARDLKIVHRCVEVICVKACNEVNFPTRSPPNWWTDELSILDVESVSRIIPAMKQRGAKPMTLASLLVTYAERNLRDLVRDHSGTGSKSFNPDFPDNDSELRAHQRELLQSIVSLLPGEKAAFPVHFLCCLLRSAIFLKASIACKHELEKRVAAILEHVTVDDLLVLSFTYDGERLFELESVRRIISGFVDKEKNVGIFNGGGDFKELYSTGMQRVAKTVDAYLGEIAPHAELTIAKFNGIAVLVPKAARKADDDLYRAIDIYLKAHPDLDEIEREKVCSVMDPLKLTYEARLHASQNKRLPVQIVLHALYYDQLQLRSGTTTTTDQSRSCTPLAASATATKNQLQTDLTLVRENEALRAELMKMKLFITDIQKSGSHGGRSSAGKSAGGASSSISSKKGTFFSSMSRTLGRLNPFKHGISKDTSNIGDDVGIDITKPRKRRFSIS